VAGSTLADALRRHPRTFDDLFTNLVEVGEAGGILDVVLQRLAAYIEKAAALKRKVKAAMVYPAAIIGVAMMVVIFMLTFVIPTFAQMFKDLGADLPMPTMIVLWLSNFVRAYILLIIAGRSARSWPCGPTTEPRRARHHRRAHAQAPRLGLVRKVAVARFTRTLGTLVQSGVPILDGLGSPPDRREQGRGEGGAAVPRRGRGR
jgi:type IV pilus assembly protein PilC